MIGKLHVVCVDIRTAEAAAKPQINAPAATQAEVAAGGNAAFKIGARTVARTGGKAALGGAAVVEIAGLAVDAHVEKVIDAARTQPETRAVPNKTPAAKNPVFLLFTTDKTFVKSMVFSSCMI